MSLSRSANSSPLSMDRSQGASVVAQRVETFRSVQCANAFQFRFHASGPNRPGGARSSARRRHVVQKLSSRAGDPRIEERQIARGRPRARPHGDHQSRKGECRSTPGSAHEDEAVAGRRACRSVAPGLRVYAGSVRYHSLGDHIRREPVPIPEDESFDWFLARIHIDALHETL